MKPVFFAACAALALAACGPSTESPAAAPAAPQTLMEQVQAQGPEDQLVTAYTRLAAYQQSHPDATPPCQHVRGTESRGVIPDDVAPDSLYAAHKGALVMSVQCGDLVSRERMDPHEHWLVVFAPGATDAAIVNCAGPHDTDACPRVIPRAAAAPASTSSATTTP
jgi:hypothetical protein